MTTDANGVHVGSSEASPLTNETYTVEELDELSGALLYAGSLHTALGQVLDVTSDADNVELVEFLNHLPLPIAASLLSVQAFALAETKVRIDELIAATTAAVKSAQARVQAEQDEAGEAEKAV